MISLSELQRLEDDLVAAFGSVTNKHDLEIVRRDWLGKEGILKGLFQKLRDVPSDEKPTIASGLNRLKEMAESHLRESEERFESADRNKKLEGEFIDLSLPGATPGLGRLHPITLVEKHIASILRPFGFKNVLGPEIETEYYCFDALNIPPHHPARDMQDTFYLDTNHILRTHTTSVQARVLQEGGLPVKVASFGKVYRNETEDASHQAMFHQFELIWVEKGLTLSHLIGIISHILKELYGKKRKIRFIPKFYPYTEPSIGPQINCTLCHGKGCPACGGAGWVTVGGAGMVHRKVLLEFNYKPEEVSGFAFGLGTARLASQLSGIPKLKMLYDSDVRILGGEK